MPVGFADEVLAETERRLTRFNSPPSEEALVLAAKKGDDLAFEALFLRYRRRIMAIAARFARGKEDAEDIAQQSFQKAYSHLHTFKGNSSFSTWLTRIALNEARMLLRRTRARRLVSIDRDFNEPDSGAVHLEIPDSAPNPETSCLQREQEQFLCAALRELRPRLRKAIELRELAELSTEETARHLGLSANAAKARVFHGRKKLREALRCLQSLCDARGDRAARSFVIRHSVNRGTRAMRPEARGRYF